jgi:hypothetical protein
MLKVFVVFITFNTVALFPVVDPKSKIFSLGERKQELQWLENDML